MQTTVDYIEIPCCNGTSLKVKIKSLIHKNRSHFQDIEIYDTEPFGKCLFLYGVIQCSEKDHEIYDRAILEKLRQDDKRLLILGGGDGYTAEMALKINPLVEITIVELDGEVVNACETYLTQKVFDHPHINLILGDAFHGINLIDNDKYDGVVCDLTDLPLGYSNSRYRDFFSSIFTLSKRILKDDGWIGIYAGCKYKTIEPYGYIAELLSRILKEYFKEIELKEVLIPSYGEPCNFIFGKKLK